MAYVRTFCKRYSSFCVMPTKIKIHRYLAPGTYNSTYTQVRKIEDGSSKPVQYSKSKAATWKARHSISGTYNENWPWYQSYVVSASVAIFLLYFCVFREESDIDEELGKSLYDRIPGLEEKQLHLSLKYNMEHGHDTAPISARLQELEKKKDT